MVFGIGDFGRKLGLEGGAIITGIGALRKRDHRELPHPFYHVKVSAGRHYL